MRLLVLIPDRLLRAAIVKLLADLSFEQVLEAANTQEALEFCSENQPDLVLIDISHRYDEADKLTAEVGQTFPQSKVVLIAHTVTLESLKRCFAAGASAYLSTNLSREALERSLKLVETGTKVYPSELLSILALGDGSSPNVRANNAQSPILSIREVDILTQLAEGRSNKVIAHALGISEATVKVHVYRIMKKIRVSNRTSAALWATRNGLKQSAVASLGDNDGAQLTKLGGNAD